MNTTLFNQIIQELEGHLTSPVNFRQLAKRLGLNEFILQRVFSIVTGISMSEYLRRRRLSAAYAELKTTNHKVVDVATRFGWSSPTAFARSFRQEFGCSPSECQNEPSGKFKLFPAFYFSMPSLPTELVEYEIVQLQQFTIYGQAITASTPKKLSVAINELYDDLRKSGHYQIYDHFGRYAIDYQDQGSLHYLAGSRQPLDFATDSFTVTPGTYAIFKVGSKAQLDIVKTIHFANEVWEKSTLLKLGDAPTLERYFANDCWLYMPLK